MSDFEDSTLRYDKMVENALRGVVKQAIEEVRDNGLPGEHHFYITFITDYPGVEIPDYLRERYPGEMTIVLQYQFYDLDVTDEYMTVTLSFNNVPEALKIPLGAISIFADPSVNFALQFQPMDETEHGEDNLLDSMSEELEGKDSSASAKKDENDEKKGEVVSLDQFRKRDK
jgi:hypothetical protein